MIEYVKHCRQNGESNATLKSKAYLFMDYHNYKISTEMQTRFLLMLYANAVGTVITNPIDVCLTKLVTQKERKYKGFIDCLIKVYRQEGPNKLMAGLHPRFMFNSINGVIFLYLYEQVISQFYNIYDERGRE